MIVLGLGFGDEGKGLTTSFLCAQTKNPIVVRFNGGHQAGHTVVHNGKRHVFSSFGSGTLQGVPTYWSKYCTFYPTAFLNEHALLSDPVIFVDPLCPVTTPFDVIFNQDSERIVRNGSVGVGFGATLQRQEANFKLFVQDFFYEKVLIQKLKAIADYYGNDRPSKIIEEFLIDLREVKYRINVTNDSILSDYSPIFEGAQGILLDQDFGFFPNVTRSNTTSKNALEIYPPNEIYYVTRSYLTRHGDGFLPGEKKLSLKNNENETNIKNEFQGEFRKAELDMSLFNYALQCDGNFSHGLRKNLVVTCMDQYDTDIPRLIYDTNCIYNKIFISKGDSLNDIYQIK